MRSNIDAEVEITKQSSSKKPARYFASAAVALGLASVVALGSAATASAAPKAQANVKDHGAPVRDHWQPQQHFVVEHGTVTTAPASSAPTTLKLSVKGAKGTTSTVTVDLSTSTKLREPGFSSATLANIVAGDQVDVVGTQSSTSAATVDATFVTLPEAHASGAVASTTSSSLTVTEKGLKGATTTVTVNVSSSTKLVEPGFSSAALANIVAGDQVLVAGTQAGTNAIGATLVVLPEAHAFGTVAKAPGATAPTSFTVTVPGLKGATTTDTVNVSTSTKLREWGQGAPALKDIVVGAKVGVVGTADGANTINATAVGVFPAKMAHAPQGHGFFGRF